MIPQNALPDCLLLLLIPLISYQSKATASTIGCQQLQMLSAGKCCFFEELE